MKKLIFLAIPALILVALSAKPVESQQSSPKSVKVEFNRDIRPILTDNCFACHGPDKNKRKGKLRLDERENAIDRKAIVPGKPEDSSLVARIFSQDDTEVMPPPETHRQLTQPQKELVKRWIAQGAEYQDHWSYIVPTRPPVPSVKDQFWVRNPIDAFILQKLESLNIKPSPVADRATLLRRVSLDLIGLPPTPEEVQAAIHSSDPQWYEKTVEGLLSSPHFGERMAVPWLDLVRFSDTVGFHGDQNQRIFPYRDYVINAFNQNMPFDQFSREQIAGDLLPNPTVEQLIATGFNRLNMMTREGGAQPKEYLAKYAADRVRTVSVTWLGSTMGCAECHNHKYDPFTQKDFYSLAAYFADLKQWGVYQDYGYTPNPDLKGWSNDHPFPPELEVESPALKKRIRSILEQMSVLANDVSPIQDGEFQKNFSRWQAQVQATRTGWLTPPVEISLGELPKPKPRQNAKTSPPKKAESKSAVNTVDNSQIETEKAEMLPDGSVLITGPVKSAPTVAVKLPPGWLSTVKLELLPHESHKNSILRSNAASVTFKPTFFFRKSGEAKEKPLGIRFADANLREPIYRNGFDLLGIRDLWRTTGKFKSQSHVSYWWLDQPIEAAVDDQLIIKIPTNLLGRVRVSISPAAPLDKHLSSDWTNAGMGQEKRQMTMFLRSTGWHAQAFAEMKRLEQRFHECRDGKTFTMISQPSKPMITRVLPRGNWLDESGEIVQPATPQFLANAEARKNSDALQGEGRGATIAISSTRTSTPERQTRLDLANWITSSENPLTSRVFVNRLWKLFFGTGLSSQLDDLGARGEWPTHPQLLDWLAVEFRESGWNVKHLVELMVLSNVYRQSAVSRLDLRESDPSNRLLAAQSPRRLEAEFIRDQALFVSGLLSPEIGGPSAFPYQPAGYYSQLQFPDREYLADRDERQYRRGVYMHWQRTFLHPMLANFDAPPREECTAYRIIANTPQQALTLLNDPSFVEAARKLAERVLLEKKTDGLRLEMAFWKVLNRSPKPKEKDSLFNLLANQREHYARQPEEAKKLLQVGNASTSTRLNHAELAAWTSLMRVLLNLHETITRY